MSQCSDAGGQARLIAEAARHTTGLRVVSPPSLSTRGKDGAPAWGAGSQGGGTQAQEGCPHSPQEEDLRKRRDWDETRLQADALIVRAGATELLAALIPHGLKRGYLELYQGLSEAEQVAVGRDELPRERVRAAGEEEHLKREREGQQAGTDDEPERLPPLLMQRLEELARLPQPRSVLMREGFHALSRSAARMGSE